MNNEMLPLFTFLLQSEDLRNQSDRIIQEVRVSGDAKRLAAEVVASIGAELVKAIGDAQKEQIDKLQQISDAIGELSRKIDDIIIDPCAAGLPAMAGVASPVADKADKKAQRK